MIAGPAALAVALILLPGWLFWRRESRPRVTGTNLAELFEVVGAGALFTGISVLAYLSITSAGPPCVAGLCVSDPRQFDARYVRANPAEIAWAVAVLVACACGLATLSANHLNRRRTLRAGEDLAYHPQVPLWVSALGGTSAAALSVETRDGRRFTGYLGGYDIGDDAAPSVHLLPPVVIESPASRTLLASTKSESHTYSAHRVTLPGSEIVAVWTLD